MSEKRRPSTRYRGEPPAKKRATTPTPPPQPRSAPTPTALVEDCSLPTRLQDGQRLPTLPEPQELNLRDSEYQNISERYPSLSILVHPKLTILLAACWQHRSNSRDVSGPLMGCLRDTGQNHPRRGIMMSPIQQRNP